MASNMSSSTPTPTESVASVVGEEGVTSLEEARKVIRELREKHRSQAHQLLTWRRRAKTQEELISRWQHERNDQLKKLSSQLLLFEARLCRKQREIRTMLVQREIVITKQAKMIKQLQNRLTELGIELPTPVEEATNLDSLNDSDSAVIMEDEDSLYQHHYHGGGGATVIRSVSDALDDRSKYGHLRRSNGGFLRRPEILETVYSVEEDGEAEAPCSERQETESLPPPAPDPPAQLTTYNRVMSNHRSVTKPKDVKYKRINKAKSKSLEELRGRLKNWVDKSTKLASSLDQ